MAFSHTKFVRLHAAARSIMLFANGASRGIFNYGSRIAFSQSYSATYATLARFSAQRAEQLKALGRNKKIGLVTCLDNVQEYAKVREHRIGRENVMKIGVASTAAVIWDYDPEAFSVKDREELLRKNKRMTLTVEGLLQMVDVELLRQLFIMQWLQTLVNYIPELSMYKGKFAEMYHTKATKLRVPDRRTKIIPLGTSAKNENIITEFRDLLVDIFDQYGQSEDKYDPDHIWFMGGDGLSFERFQKALLYLQFQDDTFRRFANVVPFLETWHAEWTFVSLLFETHWGDALTNDPSKLGHSAAKIDQNAPTNLKKVDYYSGIYLAYLVLDARLLDCFR